MSQTPEQIVLFQMDKVRKDSFQQGWDAAIESILNAAKSPFSLEKSSVTDPLTQKSAMQDSFFQLDAQISTTPKTTVSRVVDLVHNNPGITAAQMIRTLQSKYPETKERGVRSALPRLKTQRVLKSVEGKWYPYE